jgi:hypothetical protein
MTITKKTAATITVTRKTRTADGAGGVTLSWAAITGSPFTGRKARPHKPTLAEMNAGDVQVIDMVLIFPSTATVQVNDKCTVSSIDYIVTAVRSYSREVQADCTAVE